MGNKNIRKRSRGYDLFFVKPGKNSDLHEAAKKLMGIDKIKEVIIAEGAYGFIVKAEPLIEKDRSAVDREITRAVGGSSRKAMCYCQYSK